MLQHSTCSKASSGGHLHLCAHAAECQACTAAQEDAQDVVELMQACLLDETGLHDCGPENYAGAGRKGKKVLALSGCRVDPESKLCSSLPAWLRKPCTQAQNIQAT